MIIGSKANKFISIKLSFFVSWKNLKNYLKTRAVPVDFFVPFGVFPLVNLSGYINKKLM